LRELDARRCRADRLLLAADGKDRGCVFARCADDPLSKP
jgi:hypothetical protein